MQIHQFEVDVKDQNIMGTVFPYEGFSYNMSSI